MYIKFGVDSSSHSSFRAWTHRPTNTHKVTDATDHPTHTSASIAGIRNY